MKTIYLEKKQVPSNLQNLFGYRGNKFKYVVTDSVSIINTQWDGGSRNSYMLINLSTMETKKLVDYAFQHNQGAMPDVELQPNTMVVKRIIFQGKDLGLCFYVHPDNKINFLTDNSADKLTLNDKIVLQFTRSLKSSYGGVKNYRYDQARRCYKDLTLEAWNEAKQRMIDAGYLRKNGAITPAGRNVDCSEIKTNPYSVG